MTAEEDAKELRARLIRERDELAAQLVSSRYKLLHKIIEFAMSDYPLVDVERAQSILTQNGYFSLETVKTITAQQWEAMGLEREAFPIMLTVAQVCQLK